MTEVKHRAGILTPSVEEYGPFTEAISLNSAMAADGAGLAVAEDATDLYRAITANVVTLLGRTPQSATEAAETWFQYVLPTNYVASEGVTIDVVAEFIDGAGADASRDSSIDLNVYEQAAGAIGADLNATAAIVFAADDTYETKTFTITDAGLAAGDILNIRIVASAVADDANPTQIQIGEVKVNLNVV